MIQAHRQGRQAIPNLMDPLSIVASSVTVLQAAVHVSRAVEKLQSTYKLPTEFSSLFAEISDLHHQLLHCCVLVETHGSASTTPFSAEAFSERLRSSSLYQYVNCAKRRLAELRDLVETHCGCKHASPLSGARELKAFWTSLVHGKSRLNGFRDDFRDLRLGLASSLQIFTS